MIAGSCLCGAVRYEAERLLGPVLACHCTQCRKQTGHFAAGVPAEWQDIRVTGSPRWYDSSDVARRGFCPDCGSKLFWQDKTGPTWILMGTIDGPSGLSLAGNIFYADKGDYYHAGPGEPCYVRFTDGEEIAP